MVVRIIMIECLDLKSSKCHDCELKGVLGTLAKHLLNLILAS